MRFGLFGSAVARRGSGEFDSAEGYRDFIDANIEAEALGFNGTFVASSINTSAGTFQMTINGFAGLLVPQAVTVYTSSITKFRNGFTALGTVTGNVRVVGLLVKDPVSGNTVLIARYVDVLN